MACFHPMPLIYLNILTALVLAFTIGHAKADYTPPTKFKATEGLGGLFFNSAQDLCTNAQTLITPTNPYTQLISCVTKTQVYNTIDSSFVIVTATIKRPSESSNYVIDVGYKGKWCYPDPMKSGNYPNVVCIGTLPEPPNPCKDKKGQPVTWFSTSFTGADQCIDLCTAKMRSGDCGGNPPDMRCWYSGEYTGDQCNGTGQNPNPNPTPTPEPKPNPCPECDCLKSGQGYGTVNGTVVCTPKGSVGSKPTTSIKEGTTSTTTPAPTPENPNPTPVTVQAPPVIVTTTPAPAGSPAGTEPTISSSSTNPDGSTTDKTESKENFCKDNPTSKLCKAQTSCEESPEGPTCKHFCEKFPDSVACTTAQDFIGDPSGIPSEETLQEKEIAAPVNFSRVSVPSANGCPPPLTMSLYGAPIVMSFQWLCDYASAFKPLMIAFALMFAATVVMGGVRSDSQPYQRGLF